MTFRSTFADGFRTQSNMNENEVISNVAFS